MPYNINQLPSGKEDEEIIDAKWSYATSIEDFSWVLMFPFIIIAGYVIF